jgi:hypothetical protein
MTSPLNVIDVEEGCKIYDGNAVEKPRKYIFASSAGIAIIVQILLKVLVPIVGWSLWIWIVPGIWPSGPSIVINPDFFVFIIVAVLTRTLWAIFFLCPKIE